MLLFFVVLKADCVGSDDNIVVEDKFGMGGVLEDNFDVKGGAVLDREGLEVDLPEHVDVFVVDLPK